MCAQIILLHGASSSGKSTLARALQAQLEEPFWHLSIDHFRDSGALPMTRFRSGDFDWAQHREAIFDGFHAALASISGTGNHLIVVHILDDPRWVARLKTLLHGHDVFFVGVFCDLSTLTRREAARADRPAGSAAQDFHQVHQGRRYDLELDGTAPVAANVASLLQVWRSGRRVSEFHAAR